MSKNAAKPIEAIRRSLQALETNVISQLDLRSPVWLEDLLSEVEDNIHDDFAQREYFRLVDTQLGVARFGDLPRLLLKTTTQLRAYGGAELECVLRGGSFVVPVLDSADELQRLAFEKVNDLLRALEGKDDLPDDAIRRVEKGGR